MVARCAFQHPAGVIDLAQQEPFGVAAADAGIVRRAELLLAEQNVSLCLSDRAGQKPPARREERQVDIPLGAGAHQSRGGARVGKAEDAFQGVQRKPRCFGVPLLDHNGFAVQGQIAAFGQNK